MKILILSDVHGNLAALEAVFAAEPSFDQAVFLGDAVDYGPEPAACLERLEALTPVRLRGNHDNAVAFDTDCGCSPVFHDLSVASRRVTRAALSPEEIDRLRSLPTSRTFEAGRALFYLAHASPRDNLFEYVSPRRNPEQWAEAMGEAKADAKVEAVAKAGGTADESARRPDFILVGHTHLPYVRELEANQSEVARTTVANPGSVGQPRDGDPRSSYAVWTDGHIELKRVAYDVERTAAGILALDLPKGMASTMARVLRTGGRK